MNTCKARSFRLVWLLAIVLLSGCAALTTSSSSGDTLAIADQGYFHVGGTYQTIDKSEVLVGQMYVVSNSETVETAVPGCVGSWRRSDRDEFSTHAGR